LHCLLFQSSYNCDAYIQIGLSAISHLVVRFKQSVAMPGKFLVAAEKAFSALLKCTRECAPGVRKTCAAEGTSPPEVSLGCCFKQPSNFTTSLLLTFYLLWSGQSRVCRICCNKQTYPKKLRTERNKVPSAALYPKLRFISSVTSKETHTWNLLFHSKDLSADCSLSSVSTSGPIWRTVTIHKDRTQNMLCLER
jgi:hypothetical protein